MLKTKPKWSMWRNNGGKISTCPSRVDTQKGDGVEQSTPEPEVNIPNHTDLSLLNHSVKQFTNNILSKSNLTEKEKQFNNVRKAKLIANGMSKRVKDVPIEVLNDNEDEARRHKEHGWMLEDNQRESGNKNHSNSSFTYEQLKNKKLSSTLSLLFGKIAEERMGDKQEGSDKWDIDKIMFRRISKKIITDCKYSREKKQLVLMLDSSPSCRNMARVYSKIATESATFDDIEIYDAPNGYAHSIYDARTKSFRKLEREELDYTYHWKGFNNRTIIYFGDYDATSSIHSAYKYNDIHWFFQCIYGGSTSEREKEERMIGLNRDWGDKVSIYMCNDTNELITAVRDMR